MGKLLRLIVYAGLLYGVAATLVMKHVVFDGRMPSKVLDPVRVTKVCYKRAGPGTQYQTLGTTKDQLQEHWMYFELKREGRWLYLQKGKTKFWVHASCTHKPLAKASSPSPYASKHRR